MLAKSSVVKPAFNPPAAKIQKNRTAAARLEDGSRAFRTGSNTSFLRFSSKTPELPFSTTPRPFGRFGIVIELAFACGGRLAERRLQEKKKCRDCWAPIAVSAIPYETDSIECPTCSQPGRSGPMLWHRFRG